MKTRPPLARLALIALTAFLAPSAHAAGACVAAVWHVSATTGDDANDGATTNAPKATLAAALACAAAGDTVRVREGTYAGTVNIPAGVGVVAVGAREKTIIDGGHDASVSPAGGVRGVYLGGAGAYIQGFTVRNGYDAGSGGGVVANVGSAVIRCVFQNCHSGYRGGAATGGGVFIGCYFDGSNGDADSPDRAKAVWFQSGDSQLVNCLFKGQGCFGNGVTVLNCTFTGGALLRNNSNGNRTLRVYNSLVENYGYTIVPTNSVFVNQNAEDAVEADARTVFAPSDKTRVALDGYHAPRRVATLLVGLSDTTLYETLFPARWAAYSDVDCNGRPRMASDGAMDIGACQHVYNDEGVWYVDGATGDDANDGATTNAAKRTIAAALALCAAGDTVRVSEGTYGGGLVVPAGVGVVAGGARVRTIIDGGYNGLTNAPTGTRAATLGNRAYMRGFTVTNCYSASNGAVDAQALDAAIVNCAFFNCWCAHRGGAGGNGGQWIGCYFHHDVTSIDGSSNANALWNPAGVFNCVFNGEGSFGWEYPIVNASYLNGARLTNNTKARVYNCLLGETVNACALTNCVSRYRKSDKALADEACVFAPTDRGPLALDRDFAPTVTSTYLIARGERSYYDENFPTNWVVFKNVDFNLEPRFRAGDVLDIGACQRIANDEGLWYVDGVNGSDDHFGNASNAPTRTISRAAIRARRGDTVRVAEGTYGGGLVVPAGVGVVAGGVRVRTIIDGGYNGLTNAPTGTYAVQLGASAYLKGFTVRNCYGSNSGAVCAYSDDTAIIGCAFYNCFALYGAAGDLGGQWIGCYFHHDLRTLYGAAGACALRDPAGAYNCVFNGNGTTGGDVIVNASYLNGARAADASRCYNSILYEVTGVCSLTNCVSPKSKNSAAIKADADCVFNPTDKSTLALQADFSPASAATLLLGRGVRAYYDDNFPANWAAYKDMDINGCPRMNDDGEFCIGAAESHAVVLGDDNCFFYAEGSLVHVDEGTHHVVFGADMSAFHFAADESASMILACDTAEDGSVETNVLRWTDVRNTGLMANSLKDVPLGSDTMICHKHPRLVSQVRPDGQARPALYFGDKNSADSAGMRMTQRFSNVCEAHIVWAEAAKGGQFLFGDQSYYPFHRYSAQLSRVDWPATAMVGYGIIEINGVRKDKSYIPGAESYLYSFVPTQGVWISQLATDRNCNIGGAYISEVIGFTTPQTPARRRYLEDYLNWKWGTVTGAVKPVWTNNVGASILSLSLGSATTSGKIVFDGPADFSNWTNVLRVTTKNPAAIAAGDHVLLSAPSGLIGFDASRISLESGLPKSWQLTLRQEGTDVVLSIEKPDLTLQTADLRLVLSPTGVLKSFYDTAGGRELCLASQALCLEIPKKGNGLSSTWCDYADGELTFGFADGGAVSGTIETTDWGFVYTITSSTLPEGVGVRPINLYVTPNLYVGSLVNMQSDDTHAVVARAFEYESTMEANSSGSLYVTVPARFSPIGKRFALAAGARDGILAKLRAMVKASGMVHSEISGPWALDSEEARKSYIFMTSFRYAQTEAGIKAAKRAGLGIFHLDGWYSTRGQYTVSKGVFPNGLDDMVAMADKIRAAGMVPSIHCLTGNISLSDPWVKSEENTNLLSVATYTLVEPITSNSTEIVVAERPIDSHSVVMTYSSTGNALAIDGEIITYTGIRREEPYAFTGITRGYSGSRVFDHPAGGKIRYLRQRYGAFYPDVDTPLAGKLADNIARVYNAMGCGMIYLDGSEGFADAYMVAKMAALIVARLDRTRGGEPHVEMSSAPPHYWPFRTSVGTWDIYRYSPNAWVDDHMTSDLAAGPRSNMMPMQMGWWCPLLATAQYRSCFPDEAEYFTAKNAGNDAAMSIESLNFTAGFPPVLQEKNLTTLGWYERFRLARAFSEDALADLATLGKQGHLSQNEQGEWVYTPLDVHRHRIFAEGVGDDWSIVAPRAQEADLRVEAFYNLEPYESENGVQVFDEQTITVTNCGITAGGCVQIDASEHPYPDYLNLGSAGGLGFWVDGDGSGAVLNLRLENSNDDLGAISDNLLVVDFTGRRYVELLFRERDVEQLRQWTWPTKSSISELESALLVNKVVKTRLYVNNVPAGREASIHISAVKALPLATTTLTNVVLTVNGNALPVPFDLISGDWAELKGGVWNCYNEKGILKARREGGDFGLLGGTNTLHFSSEVNGGSMARAEVRLFAKNDSVAALKTLTQDQRRQLSWEAAMPEEYAPSKGASQLAALRTRPGENARIELTLRGPISNAVATISQASGDVTWPLGTVAAGASADFTDGPVISGVASVTMTSSHPDDADALVEFVKRYDEATATNAYWVGASGDWNDLSNWADEQHAPLTVVPGLLDDVVHFPTAAGSAPTVTAVRIDAPLVLGCISGGAGYTLAANRLNIYGADDFAGIFCAASSGSVFRLQSTAAHPVVLQCASSDLDLSIDVVAGDSAATIRRVVGGGRLHKIGAGTLTIGAADGDIVLEQGELALGDGVHLSSLEVYDGAALSIPAGHVIHVGRLIVHGSFLVLHGGGRILSLSDPAAAFSLAVDADVPHAIGSDAYARYQRLLGGNGCVDVSGTGTVAIADFRPWEIPVVSVEGGRLELAVQGSNLLEKAIYRFDASKASSLSRVGDAVLSWADADGRDLRARSALWAGVNMRTSVAHPEYRSVETRPGVVRPAVWFGNRRNTEDSAGVNTNAAGMVFSRVIRNLRDSFTVYADVQYAWMKTGEIIGNALQGLDYSHYWRSGTTSLFGRYAAVAVTNGYIALDGREVSAGCALGAGYHVISFGPTAETYVDSLMEERSCNAGGGIICEQLAFDCVLTAHQRKYVESSLAHKWFEAPVPCWTNDFAEVRLGTNAVLALEQPANIALLAGAGRVVSPVVAGVGTLRPTGPLAVGGTFAQTRDVVLDVSGHAAARQAGLFAILTAEAFERLDLSRWSVTGGLNSERARLVRHDNTIYLYVPKPTRFTIY